MIRNTLFLPLMAAAIGGPMFFLAGLGEKEPAEAENNEIPIDELDPVKFDPSSKTFYEADKNLSGIFNFNLTPALIEKKWKKLTKSQVNGFQIYRTSILSGHGDQDIVGAVTYHFHSGDRLQSIRFHGFSVDPSNLINLASSEFGFGRVGQNEHEFRPSALAGYSGLLKLTRSTKYQDQLKIEFEVGR